MEQQRNENNNGHKKISSSPASFNTNSNANALNNNNKEQGMTITTDPQGQNFLQRRGSYDHDLYKRYMYQRTYTSDSPKSPTTPIKCFTFEDQSTGLSSPQLKPITDIHQNRATSPFNDLDTGDGGKGITEAFLFQKYWRF